MQSCFSVSHTDVREVVAPIAQQAIDFQHVKTDPFAVVQNLMHRLCFSMTVHDETDQISSIVVQ